MYPCARHPKGQASDAECSGLILNSKDRSEIETCLACERGKALVATVPLQRYADYTPIATEPPKAKKKTKPPKMPENPHFISQLLYVVLHTYPNCERHSCDFLSGVALQKLKVKITPKALQARLVRQNLSMSRRKDKYYLFVDNKCKELAKYGKPQE